VERETSKRRAGPLRGGDALWAVAVRGQATRPTVWERSVGRETARLTMEATLMSCERRRRCCHKLDEPCGAILLGGSGCAGRSPAHHYQPNPLAHLSCRCLFPFIMGIIPYIFPYLFAVASEQVVALWLVPNVWLIRDFPWSFTSRAGISQAFSVCLHSIP
jgi:hypothetical protein